MNVLKEGIHEPDKKFFISIGQMQKEVAIQKRHPLEYHEEDAQRE